jgi:hypothetical protein
MPASTTTILSFLEPFDNPAYILPDKPRVDAAQAVIGAGLEDDDIGLQGQHPIDTRQGAAGRLAAHPGVDHPHIKASILQLPLQQGRIALLFRHPQAGSEAVPDRDDGQGGLYRHVAGAAGTGTCSSCRQPQSRPRITKHIINKPVLYIP